MSFFTERLGWARRLSPDHMGRSLVAAGVVGLLQIASAVSVGSLVFGGALAPVASIGIGLYLVSLLVNGLLIPILSDNKAWIAGPKSGHAPIFAAMAAGIATDMAGRPLEAVAATVVVALLCTSFLVGLFLWLVGKARLGSLARFIPFPVASGFFTGLGVLMLYGGIKVAGGAAMEAAGALFFLSPSILLHVLPAAAFGCILYGLERKIAHWTVVPLFLAAALALFYGLLLTSGITLEQAADLGWLKPSAHHGANLVPVFTPDQFGLVDWTAVLHEYGKVGVLCLLSVILALLDVSGAEVVIERDLDPNRELRAMGAANMIGVGATSIMGLGESNDMALAARLGGVNFTTVLLIAALVAGFIAIGPAPLGYLPPCIIGGFLVFLGLHQVASWFWKLRKSLPTVDLAVIAVIVATIATIGVLEGVGVGIMLATALFVRRYSRLNVVKRALTSAEFLSSIDRHKEDQAWLDDQGHRVQIFVLQGFLFFGTANRMLERIKEVIASSQSDQQRYLVVDLNSVDDMDSSAANSFSKLMQACARDGLTLCIAANSQKFLNILGKIARDLPLEQGTLQTFADLDSAVGWCDDQLLGERNAAEHRPSEPESAEDLLRDLIVDVETVGVIRPYFEDIAVHQGQVLFHEGDQGNSLYLIQSGSVAIVLTLPDGSTLPVRTMRTGAILGEMALFTGEERAATAIVNADGTLLRLGRAEYDAFIQDHPAHGQKFTASIVRLMAERLGRSNKSVVALSR
ncbi:SLC26A/SulP transporter family protein [Donghicola sp. C2-DW-16]|uniref:SLC26A/SulP transporter family protein n=1 Tax=Donghicola mangrovi TaxID=2729614 RepID=A0ABX2PJL5_9RHOB|nr:cyclic nucleotide-binding domain-containing protein [Donghicola mangrovi]NVO29296.1 SLC26A/SulP transporter family protein [Donghicola mangrovi]